MTAITRFEKEEQFKESYAIAEKRARQIAKFITYPETNPRQRRVSEDGPDYEIDL